MKGRLSSKVWTLTVWVFLAVFGVLGLAYRAGSNAGAESPGHGGIDVWLIGGGALALLAGLSIPMALSGSLLSGVRELAEFSERFAAGDSRAKADVKSDDELGYIAENLNRAVAKVSKATSNQEATETLQRSITDLLGVINQVARGDLTLRGKVTNDALGNVVDSINYMLDNFTKVLERVRKAATDVNASANAILLSADEMTAGATQQDQEITNTSSAVEELTVSMKQVSNNAEASAEAARRALDAAEQGNRAVRDTLEGMQRIRASVQATAKKIKSLGDRSLEISEIINVINDITEQTNLLALNAAIEAARAGEAGRGFAVVADEVRKLAERSVEATKEIGEVIRQVQAETGDAVETAKAGAAETKEGINLAHKAGLALRSIIDSVSRSSQRIAQIASATAQQSLASDAGLQELANVSAPTRQG